MPANPTPPGNAEPFARYGPYRTFPFHRSACMDNSPDDDAPIPIDEPQFTLDPVCPTCHGTGVMEEGSRLLECTCVLRQRIAHYLTPQFGPEISWHHNFPAEQYMHKDVLIENTGQWSVLEFRRLAFAAVKSFLLLTGRRFSHRTVRPYEVFRHLFGNDAHGSEELFRGVNLLIILFGGDDPARNNTYPRELPWLIRTRRDYGLATWIISTAPLNGTLFNKQYPGLREPLLDCTADFVRLPLQPAPAQ